MTILSTYEDPDMNSEQIQEPQSSASSPTDAIEQLKADHQKVKGMFTQFEQMKNGVSDEEKGALVDKIVEELNVHETVENEVFFPAVKQVLRKQEVLKEATEDQSEAGDAIQALSHLRPGEPGYEENVKDLGKQIAAHAEEEEKDVFPKVQNSEIDTSELGDKLSARKSELKQELGKASK